jgi:hypothetical protein
MIGGDGPVPTPGEFGAGMMAMARRKSGPGEVRVGKFAILATYT